MSGLMSTSVHVASWFQSPAIYSQPCLRPFMVDRLKNRLCLCPLSLPPSISLLPSPTLSRISSFRDRPKIHLVLPLSDHLPNFHSRIQTRSEPSFFEFISLSLSPSLSASMFPWIIVGTEIKGSFFNLSKGGGRKLLLPVSSFLASPIVRSPFFEKSFERGGGKRDCQRSRNYIRMKRL